MKPATKYILIFSIMAGLALASLLLLANTKPNAEVVITNNTDQSIDVVDLKTNVAGNNIRLHGVDMGTEVTVKLHTDGGDSLSLFVRFSDGKELRGGPISIEPGVRVTQSVKDNKIIAGPDSKIPEL